jgi:hypothetical protein
MDVSPLSVFQNLGWERIAPSSMSALSKYWQPSNSMDSSRASQAVNLCQIFLSAPVFNQFPKLSLGIHNGIQTAMLGARSQKTVEGESYAKVVLLFEWHSLYDSTNLCRNGERVE